MRLAPWLAAALATVALAACSSDPEPATATSTESKDPKQLLVGKWESSESWFRFDEDGRYEGSEQGVEMHGRYRWLDGERIEMELTLREDLQTKVVRRVEVSEAQLRLVEDGGGAAVLERAP